MSFHPTEEHVPVEHEPAGGEGTHTCSPQDIHDVANKTEDTAGQLRGTGGLVGQVQVDNGSFGALNEPFASAVQTHIQGAEGSLNTAATSISSAATAAHGSADLIQNTEDTNASRFTAIQQDMTGETGTVPAGGGAANADQPGMPWTGGGLRGPTDEEQAAAAEAAYEAIRQDPTDVGRIAANTGLDPQVLATAKNNLFVETHDIAEGPGPENLVHRRFTPDQHFADLWTKAANGEPPLTDEEYNQFRSLMAHEYVENQLMAAGLPFQSSHPDAWDDDMALANPDHPSAHLVAPRSFQANPAANLFSHWPSLKLTPPEGGMAQDLSNLDEVVAAAKRGLNL